MDDLSAVGRLFIVFGVVLLVVGLLLAFGSRVPFLGSLGKLPGDIVYRRGNITIAIPLVTSLLLSLLLTLILNLFFRR